MGNCQTTDVVAVLIQHPDGRTEKANCPLSASHVMAANPGHYVAVVITLISQRRSSSSSASATADDRREKVVRYLKLLGPEEPLQLGHFYRLVSFEDVLREFGTKRRVRLSKLLSKKKEIIKKSCDGEANASAASSSPVSCDILNICEGSRIRRGGNAETRNIPLHGERKAGSMEANLADHL
ncbi:hypothetical protein ZIOFF_073809 [Zingiber officinale]|uniref:Uncharacterized protein n=1 Tax=Zingiber officinale TaxID=94328 RepID=A0A8J5EPK2_ZINOF|nr:hypothetical protein ZIOFF_073809 [Zingiber officinale]